MAGSVIHIWGMPQAALAAQMGSPPHLKLTLKLNIKDSITFFEIGLK
jgi:hypothetical protein